MYGNDSYNFVEDIKMENKIIDGFEQMDPDFGRVCLSGVGFGVISNEEYAELIHDLQNND